MPCAVASSAWRTDLESIVADPHLKMAEMDLPGPLPDDVEAIAQIATNLVLGDVTAGKVSYLILLTFRGNKARLWQLHDVTAADDVVRALVERNAPEAIAFVHPMPLPPEVEGERGYNVAVEAPTAKFDSLIALWGGGGLGAEMVRIYGRRITDVTNRWFGVPPEGEVDMWFEGVVGATGPTGEA